LTIVQIKSARRTTDDREQKAIRRKERKKERKKERNDVCRFGARKPRGGRAEATDFEKSYQQMGTNRPRETG
jgi:hypothetical protein